MLNKILTNLRFNPDYIRLLKDYQENQSREKLIRGLGLMFIGLAFVVQLFAYSPASSQTNASASDNDLIPGGVSSQAQLASDCYTHFHNVDILYGDYGISCDEIAGASSPVVTLHSTDYGGNLWSMGHLPYGIAGETPVNIFGGTVYWRMLHGWDRAGTSSTYTALRVTSVDNKAYWILFQCGNLVSLGFPTPYTPPPAPTPAPPPPAQPPKHILYPSPRPPACIYNSQLTANNPACKPCPSSKGTTDVVSCLFFSKTATNTTKNIADANNTTASPGDNILYTLTIHNKGQAKEVNYIVQDRISDILDYATVTNVNGGSVSTDGIISWPAIDIPSQSTITKQFVVTVKNPLPNYAVNQDDPQGYNNVMTNVYGNTINVSVKAPTVVAVTNAATTTLPNTGPGTGIFILFLVTTVVGYFYSRSRLLNKEALIAEAIVHRGDQ